MLPSSAGQMMGNQTVKKLFSFAGPILGFPLINVSVLLHEFEASPGTSLAMVAACAMQCTTQAVRQASPQLLEPMMRLEVGHLL